MVETALCRFDNLLDELFLVGICTVENQFLDLRFRQGFDIGFRRLLQSFRFFDATCSFSTIGFASIVSTSCAAEPTSGS